MPARQPLSLFHLTDAAGQRASSIDLAADHLVLLSLPSGYRARPPAHVAMGAAAAAAHILRGHFVRDENHYTLNGFL